MKKFRFRNGSFAFGNAPIVMGILNVTPDSFSDGGVFFDADKAVAHALQMKKDGAHIIDIGAVSTRPGSDYVSPEEEWERLRPVLERLSKEDIIISVDTFNPSTAESALSSGAHIINDVSGVFNSEMAAVVRKYDAGWIMTHTCNVPSGTKKEYPNGVVNEVNSFFDSFIEDCINAGLSKDQLCIDPGFGFAKDTADNVELLRNLEKTVREDVAYLTALSRKRFIGELTDASETSDRLAGTLAADIIALQKGSDILRVHDVRETVQTIAIYNSIK